MTTPHPSAVRARRALQNENGRRLLAREEFLTPEEIEQLIDRETGVGELVAALELALDAANLGQFNTDRTAVWMRTKWMGAARQALTRHHQRSQPQQK